jgi:hypothetical protein
MTNNPLIEKYEEIYGKKEEPKPEPIEDEPIVSSNLCSEISLPKPPQKRYLEYYDEYGDYDYLKVAIKAYEDIWDRKIPTRITPINPSWDDTFREISLKITNKNARVSKLDKKLTNGLKKTTYTIEVEVYD